MKDEGSDKYRALNVKSADGSPCPQPPKRERKSGNKKDKKDGDGDKKDGEGNSNGNKTGGGDDDNDDDGEKAEGGKKKSRRKRGGGKKKGGGASGSEDSNGKSNGNKKDGSDKKESERQPTWEASLDESVQKSMTERGITVDNQGRAFLSVGDDVRIKLGTDSYAAMAHSKALLAEGEWSVDSSNGKITIVWKKVLKWGEGSGDSDKESGVWSVSSAEAEASLLVSEFTLTDGKFPDAHKFSAVV
jgi:hypothetical protein